MSGARRALDRALTQFATDRSFRPFMLMLESDDTGELYMLKGNPQRFVPSLFDEDWPVPGRRPDPGECRALRAITGSDGVDRIIVRQGNKLFAYPLA